MSKKNKNKRMKTSEKLSENPIETIVKPAEIDPADNQVVLEIAGLLLSHEVKERGHADWRDIENDERKAIIIVVVEGLKEKLKDKQTPLRFGYTMDPAGDIQFAAY